MSEFAWQPYEHPGLLLPKLAAPFGPFANMLDIGGGGGVVGWGTGWDPTMIIHVLDMFPPSASVPNFRLGNGLDAATIYGEKSFDIVMMAEVIEHLTKEDGITLLSVAERVARKLILITTPQGFDKQDPAEYPNEPWANNPYQKHLCGWMPEELASYGYSILLNGGPVAANVTAYKVPT